MSWADWEGRERDPFPHETPPHDPTDSGNVWAWWTPERIALALGGVCLILALLR